jgi:8-oxo-dGTP diphosphatase
MTNSETPPTEVVTCFLMRRVPEGPEGFDQVLLVQRSERVRTYRGHWAAISGYLERGATPLQQAREELREEVGLEEDDAILVRAGEPLTFTDETVGISWTVHPFLFQLREGGEIHTDWEAQTSRWMTPMEIDTIATVPMLREALARVYPGTLSA